MAILTTVVVILLELLIFAFLIPMSEQAQTNHSNIIKLGSTLSLNLSSHKNISSSCWFSPSGLFAFGFHQQGNGFAVGIWMVNQTETTIVWTANRDDPPFSSNATLELTEQGLRLRTLFSTSNNTDPKFIQGKLIPPLPNGYVNRTTNSAALLDSGNFVLYGGKNSSSPLVIGESFDSPTDTILAGQDLTVGDQLVSSVSGTDHSSGKHRLSMQRGGIGSLVLYPVNTSETRQNAYWIPYAGSYFYGYLSLNCTGSLFLGDGNTAKYILRNGSSSSSSCSSRASDRGKSTSIIYRVALDADGMLRLYSHHNTFLLNNITSRVFVEWSALNNQCEVKGFCGLNSFCGIQGKKANCYCYPGFAFINFRTKSLGCYRNFTAEGCERENNIGEPPLSRTSLYNITPLENMWWEDSDPYSDVPMKREACSKSCLGECDCWAVLHSSGQCRKYKLPLRYGKRDPNITATGFFKVVRLGDYVLNNSSLAMNPSERLHRYNKFFMENANLGLAQDFSLQSFSYDELERATEGFKEELGRGLFGAVYKGTLLLGGNIRAIAVKRLEKAVEEGIREFRAEMSTIGRTHHRNLVQLLGFCIEGSKRLLVYEFMSNGSLADLLFKATTRPPWKDRVRYVLEVAKGVLYLHEECAVHIIHCNLKPQNVLLDDNWTAKISDFGFARLLLIPSQVKISEALVEGYSAPEWKKNTIISVKADVYSFGVVLLEVICCRRNINLKVSNDEEMVLCNWAYNCFKAGELNKLVEGDQTVEARTLERLVRVGLWCIQDDPDLRPLMKNVILMLEGTMDVPLPPLPP